MDRESLLATYDEPYYEKHSYLVGIDEVGRGPLAGPVVAAACYLPRGFIIPKINDSKKLSPKLREELYFLLTTDQTIHWATGWASVEEIDEHNIYQATVLAMKRAIQKLRIRPDALLIDGLRFDYECPSYKVIKGDTLSQVIAAASILAKVERDRYLQALDDQYPEYGFAKHKGYPTPQHLKVLKMLGPCHEHRKSFAPVKEAILNH